MKIPQYLLSCLLVFLVCEVNSQDLKLETGSRTKVIKAGSYITVELPTPNQEPCDDCPLTSMTGQLVSSVDGKINLRVRRSSEPLVELQENVGALTKNYKQENAPVLSIPKDVIMSVTKASSKSESATSWGTLVGGVLFWAGTGHLISSPVAGYKDNQNGSTLLWLGLSELVVGTVLLSFSQQKPYITSIHCPQKSRGKGSQIWTIR